MARSAHKGVESTLRPGDFVWLHSPPPLGVSPKLHKAWTGPWQISGVEETQVTIVRMGPLPSPRHARTLSVHVDWLRLMVGRRAVPVQPAPDVEPVQPALEPVLDAVPIPRVSLVVPTLAPLDDQPEPQVAEPMAWRPQMACRLPPGSYAQLMNQYDHL